MMKWKKNKIIKQQQQHSMSRIRLVLCVFVFSTDIFTVVYIININYTDVIITVIGPVVRVKMK